MSCHGEDPRRGRAPNQPKFRQETSPEDKRVAPCGLVGQWCRTRAWYAQLRQPNFSPQVRRLVSCTLAWFGIVRARRASPTAYPATRAAVLACAAGRYFLRRIYDRKLDAAAAAHNLRRGRSCSRKASYAVEAAIWSRGRRPPFRWALRRELASRTLRSTFTGVAPRERRLERRGPRRGRGLSRASGESMKSAAMVATLPEAARSASGRHAIKRRRRPGPASSSRASPERLGQNVMTFSYRVVDGGTGSCQVRRRS